MGSFNNDNVGRYCFGRNYFEIKNLDFFENFIFENGWGIVYIDFVMIVNVYVKFFLDVVQKMCEYGMNVGGLLEILEVFFFEFFVIWRGSELEMVSRM